MIKSSVMYFVLGMPYCKCIVFLNVMCCTLTHSTSWFWAVLIYLNFRREKSQHYIHTFIQNLGECSSTCVIHTSSQNVLYEVWKCTSTYLPTYLPTYLCLPLVKTFLTVMGWGQRGLQITNANYVSCDCQCREIARLRSNKL